MKKEDEILKEMVARQSELTKLQREIYGEIEDFALRRKFEELTYVVDRLLQLEALNRERILMELVERFKL